jgi:hypothetical protein
MMRTIVKEGYEWIHVRKRMKRSQVSGVCQCKLMGGFLSILELSKFEGFDTFIVSKLREGCMSRLVTVTQ